uniref:Protein CUSTOS n=1 Tax=Caenorhabditis tropicalis TaxID=1561998 RepID=A0A1I7TNN2_9PELO
MGYSTQTQSPYLLCAHPSFQMSDAEYFKEQWQVKEVFEVESGVEPQGNVCIINMMYEHSIACVAHIILSNHTWSQKSIQVLIPFYETIGEEFNEKLLKLQKCCEQTAFHGITEKVGLLELPIYSKCVDPSKLVESSSRVYHDATEYLNEGSANLSEIQRFLSTVLKEVFQSVFSVREIRHVIKDIVKTLVESSEREEEIGMNVKKDLTYEFAMPIQNLHSEVPDFQNKIMGSITNFIGYFALHTIRRHCYVNFGVDGELKFYQKEMHRKALEDKKTLQTRTKEAVKIKSETSVKNESKRLSGAIRVKPEKDDSDSDDFCEIIETPVKQPTKRKSLESNTEVKQRQYSESNANDSKDFPEKYLLEDLDKDTLPMTFKHKFRKLVENNQMLRDEICDYKFLIQMKIAEKKKLL